MSDKPKTLREIETLLTAFAVQQGGLHEDDCPMDDTCDCKWREVNRSFNDVVSWREQAEALVREWRKTGHGYCAKPLAKLLGLED